MALTLAQQLLKNKNLQNIGIKTVPEPVQGIRNDVTSPVTNPVTNPPTPTTPTPTTPTPTTPTGVTDPTAQSIYDTRMSLAEQVAAEQRRLAEEAMNYKRQSLAEQLEQQRRSYAQNLSMMNEQVSGRGSQLLQGLANRGLATSGLLQLGDVQTQLAKGQGLSNLAYQQRMGESAIAQEQRGTSSELASALRQAELDKASMNLGAEEGLYSMLGQEKALSQQELNDSRQYALSMMEAAGTLGSDQMGLYNQIMNAKTPEEIIAIVSGIDFQDIATGKTTSTEDIQKGLLGTSGFDEKIFGSSTDSRKVVIGGKEYFYNKDNPEQFNREIQNVYDTSELKYAGQGLITVDAGRGWFGTKILGGTDFVRNNPFVTQDGKRFRTWNDAVAHLDSLKEQG